MVAAAVVWISLIVSVAFFAGMGVGRRTERAGRLLRQSLLDEADREIAKLNALERINISSVPSRW